MFVVASWQSLSPYLNTTEKLWSALYHKFNANNKQFLSANELKIAILKEQSKISESELNDLVSSIKNWVCEVIRKNRGPI